MEIRRWRELLPLFFRLRSVQNRHNNLSYLNVNRREQNVLIFSHRASRHKHLGASKRHDRGSENHNFSWENYIFMSLFPPKCADGPAVSRRQTYPLINYTQPLCIHTRTRVCSSSSDCVHAHVHSRLRRGLPAEESVVQQRGDGGRNK